MTTKYYNITSKSVAKLTDKVNQQIEYWDNRMIKVRLFQIIKDETDKYVAIMERLDKYESNI